MSRGRARASAAALLLCATTAMSTAVSPAAQAQDLAHSPSATRGHPKINVGTAQRSAGLAAGASYDWPEFHLAPGLQGYASNGSVTTANAAQLGVSWATDLYGPALDSPVVAYDAALNETLAYIGTEQGDVLAVNTAGGQIVWSTWLGSAIRATPAVTRGSVYVATSNSSRIYRLDSSTGAVQCSVASPRTIEGSPVIATPPGGVTSIYYGTNDAGASAGPMMAVNASTCAIEWEFTGYAHVSGTWDPAAYAVDAGGEPLVLFGSADPDSGVYALDAVTGQEVWRFGVDNPPPGVYDIGAGVTVSPPGTITADGVAYVPSKYGIMYALDLTTGAKMWSYNFDSALSAPPSTSLSTAALDGNDLVFGYGKGLADLNPVTGALNWSYTDPASGEVLSSPAISGPAGSEVVAAGDLGGGFEVVSLATGAQLFHYQTGGYVTASPAVSGGNILVASSDGFLYDFAAGSLAPATAPTTAITSPADSSTLANPGGNLTVTGTAATDPATSIAKVVVAVQTAGQDGPWWDASSGAWISGPIGNSATLASPGVDSSTWSFSYPVPPGGGTYQVTAYTVSAAGQSDITGAHSGFAVLATTTGPHLKVFPGFAGPGSKVTVSGGGFGKSDQVTIALQGTTLATVTTTSTGALPAGTKVTIPLGATFGQTSLTATTAASGKSAAAAIVITNSWSQLGYGPGHAGLEPNDTTLNQLVSPGGDIFLDPAWQFQTGAAVDTAPAITRDVAYVANDAGQLTAVDVHNGAPSWTWTLPSGAAIRGSPAVDPQPGLVFAGADNGTLNAVATGTGELAWTAAAGASGTDVSAPVYGGGEVYVTANTTSGGTTTSTVEAFAEASGTRTWSVTGLAGPLAAPALDTARNTLVIGGPTGVMALNAGTGATDWTFAAGAVTAPPAIDGSTVYFGSADDKVYAVSEATGTKTWSFQTPKPVSDTPALSNQGTPGNALTVLIGSGNGTLYALNAANGSLDFSQAIGAPIVGVAAVKQVAIIDTSAGVVGACRTYAAILLWRHTVSNAGITSPPAIVDGTVYLGAGDGGLYAFTGYGQPPP
jgi:outer membrane protein assembly factor BamB